MSLMELLSRPASERLAGGLALAALVVIAIGPGISWAGREVTTAPVARPISSDRVGHEGARVRRSADESTATARGRAIPVVASVKPARKHFPVGGPIHVTLCVINGLAVPIRFQTFSRTPNDWNGETVNCSLVDVYRDGRRFNLVLASPVCEPPPSISGMGAFPIAPGKSMEVTLDLSKWKLRDGWKPGTYEAVLRVDNLLVQPGMRLSLASEPFTFVVFAGRTPPATTRSSSSQPPPAEAKAPAPWQTSQLGRAGDFAVRIAVKGRSSPADEHWLRLEFVNDGKSPVRVKNASYSIDRQVFDLPAGTAAHSGGLASGNTFDLFPDAWKTTPVSPILLPPGVTAVAEHPSGYSTALLGLPPQTGWQVKATARAYVDLADGRRISTPDRGVEVTFVWVYPDEAGLAAMRKRLKALLGQPVNRPYHGYLLSGLLKMPPVAEAVNLEELLAGLRIRKGPFDGRPYLVDHLNAHHPKDPKVVGFYLAALGAADWAAAEDLLRLPVPRKPRTADQIRPAPGIWDDRFVEPLVRMNEQAADHYPKHRYVLTVLNRMYDRWKHDGSVAPRLSAALYKHFPGLKADPGRLDEWGVRSWASQANLLGLTRDPAALALLQPWLEVKVAIDRGSLPRDMIARRACDVAHNAIRDLLGGGRKIHFYSNAFPAPRQDTIEQRDALIKSLKAELARAASARAKE